MQSAGPGRGDGEAVSSILGHPLATFVGAQISKIHAHSLDVRRSGTLAAMLGIAGQLWIELASVGFAVTGREEAWAACGPISSYGAFRVLI